MKNVDICTIFPFNSSFVSRKEGYQREISISVGIK